MSKQKQPEIYVSIDIEADGPIPGVHSMLSLGAVAYDPFGNCINEYSANFDTLEGASPHPQMEAWWLSFPDAWAAHRLDTRPPEVIMPEFADWLESLPGLPVFVAWPATWDFMWIYWYLIRFADGRRPFSEHGIDVRSYAMGMRRQSFGKCSKTYLPKRWFPSNPRKHVALDDAREQGDLFVNMLKENMSRGSRTEF